MSVWEFSQGKQNLITDVKGLKVGHATIKEGDIQTGVTVLIPREDIFNHKLAAASHVINGFGKTSGLIQIDELGTLESPIALTNTLAVGICWQTVCQWLIDRNPQLKSVNPIICECNDSYLNDIRKLSITKDLVMEAFASAETAFALGAIGAGRGMICHGLKGGIGSASRLVEIDHQTFTIGTLLLTNHGRMCDLTLHGKRIGPEVCKRIEDIKKEDVGSVIVLIATDIPLSSLQLKRVCHRVSTGLAQTGSRLGHGSGEVAIAFSTANIVQHDDPNAFRASKELSDRHMDTVFRATIECVEDGVLSSLFHAESVTGVDGHRIEALKDWWTL